MVLDSIHERFSSMITDQRDRDKHIDIKSFIEEISLSSIGLIVPNRLAAFEGQEAIPINANHIITVRFELVDDVGFQRVLGILQLWMSGISRKQYSLLVLLLTVTRRLTKTTAAR
jgi:hypothetical protein